MARRPARRAPRTSKKHGTHRSGLEVEVNEQFKAKGVDGRYEETVLKYTVPASVHEYTPDFELPVGSKRVFIEVKGYFDDDDRKKILHVRDCNPDVEIRMLFKRASNKLRKTTKTTYATWCNKHGIRFCEKVIPEEWWNECD